MNVLVNGIGNIGTTLLCLLSEHKELLGINSIYALKNNPQPWNDTDLSRLQNMGIIVCTKSPSKYVDLATIINDVQYIFDCTNNGGGLKNKQWYSELPNLIACSAQGSEKAFGTSFMSGINDSIITNCKYAHIVSCNTHSLASILSAICHDGLSNLKSADFVIVRRSEDIGNHERLVSANVIARHLDNNIGTHHSIDVKDLYKTINIEVPVTSSDVTTPSQLMHSVRFNLELHKSISAEDVQNHISTNSFLATTDKFDSNVIFELGRRFGFQGRIYSHAVVVSNNLLIHNDHIKGWAFIPQEGNTLISTLHAYLLQTNKPNTDRTIEKVKSILLSFEY